MPVPRATASFLSLFLSISIVSICASAQTSPATIISFSTITSIDPLPNGIELHDGPLTMRITALRDDVLRIRASRTAMLPEDASWAVLPEARSASIAVTQDSNPTIAGFHTTALRLSIDRATGLLTLSDNAGNILQQDAEPLQFQGEHYRIANTMPADEHYFGLGDKTGAFDRREQAFRMWNTDAYGWQESTDPIYKSIPFYLTYRAGVSLGVLIDNTWPSSFDFGKTLGDTFQYRAEGGPADIYLLYGPSAKQVLSTYAWLTGPTPLPPLWTLGFQQSRYSYMTQARVLEVADRLRKDKIPSDALYLDIDYQEKNRPFTINTASFPDMPGMIATLHNDNFHVVAITDLHIAHLPNQNYAPYDSGTAGDHFVKNPDGSQYVGPVWPGPSVFPDFTQTQTRAWWGTLYTSFTHMGIDGFWNDMSEPSVFNPLKTMPCNVLHRIDEPGFASRTATHCEIHNVYGMENSRATFDGQLTLKPDTRPFVLTRATYAGGQRYAATWTGDNSSTWNHLRQTTPQLINLGLSGFGLAGADVGGFAGSPQPELLTKWLEIAAFHPIDRDHTSTGTYPQEPWENGTTEDLNLRRHFIEERYRLMSYIYTTAEEMSSNGMPIMRPLFLEFPNSTKDGHPIDLATNNEFLLGPDLLIAPSPYPDELDDYPAALPPGGWYNYWTGERLKTGVEMGRVGNDNVPDSDLLITLHPSVDTLPVFARAGSIVPIQPLVQSTEEKPQGPLTLRVYPPTRTPMAGDAPCEGSLYLDDGISYAYQKGQYLREKFTCELTPTGITIKIAPREGNYTPWWTQFSLEIYGATKPATSAIVNGTPIPATYYSEHHHLTAVLPDNGKGAELLVLY
jgi:alpha-glucosidase